jgi:O-antigen/teichoic acid export membrane protein
MPPAITEKDAGAGFSVGPLSAVAGNIARNFGSLLVGRLGSQLIGFATNAYLAHRIAPAGYGAVGLAQAAVTYLTIFSDSALSTIAVREGAQHPGKVQSLIASVSALRLLLALGCMLAGLLVAGYLPYSESSRQILRVFAISLPVQAIAVDWVFRALQKMHYTSIVQIASSALTLALTVCLVKNPGQVLRVPWIGVVAGAGAVALSLWLLRQVGYRLRFQFGFGAFRRHLAQSIPLCASSLAITLYIQVNYLILGKVHGEAVVGLYSAAARLTVVLSTVHWLYYAAMAPGLMALYQVSRPKAGALLGQSVRVTAIFGFGMLAIGLPASRLLVQLVFGPAFTDATPVFAVMLASAAVVAVSHNWGQLAVAAHRERLVLKSTLLGGLMNLVVCGLLVRPLGAVGAATGNLLAEIAVAFALYLPWPAEFRGAVLRPALGPAASCVMAILFARLASPWWGEAPAAALCVVIYGAALFLFGSITMNDLQRVRSAFASFALLPPEGPPHV